MKKLIFTFSLAVSFCKGADVPDSWTQAVRRQYWLYNFIGIGQKKILYLTNNQIDAIPENLNLPKLQMLSLKNNQITAISADLNLPQLEVLLLSYNHIEHVDPKILKQLPRLFFINLSHNPLSHENVNELRNAAITAGREELDIIAHDIENEDYLRPGRSIKGAVKR